MCEYIQRGGQWEEGAGRKVPFAVAGGEVKTPDSQIRAREAHLRDCGRVGTSGPRSRGGDGAWRRCFAEGSWAGKPEDSFSVGGRRRGLHRRT
jgi:hypothetical protein